MRFVADQCCSAIIVAGLRADGHDVWSVRESAPGAKDEVILQAAVQDDRIILTEDKDFGDLVVRRGLPACGILLIRMHEALAERKLVRVREILSNQAHNLAKSFVVVTDDSVRFRPLSPSSASET